MRIGNRSKAENRRGREGERIGEEGRGKESREDRV